MEMSSSDEEERTDRKLKKNVSLAPTIIIEESKDEINQLSITVPPRKLAGEHIISSEPPPPMSAKHPKRKDLPIWKLPARRMSTLTNRKILGLELPKPMKKIVSERTIHFEKDSNSLNIPSDHDSERKLCRRPTMSQFCLEDGPDPRVLAASQFARMAKNREEEGGECSDVNKDEQEKGMAAVVKMMIDKNGDSNFFKGSKDLESKHSKELDKKEHTIKLFLEKVKTLSDTERYNTASTLFRDAVFSRNPRYLFSSNITRKLYSFQGNPAWVALLSYLSWIYLIMTLFEPSHSSSRELEVWGAGFSCLFALEILILTTFITNEIIDFILKFTDIERGGCLNFLKSKKYMLLLLIDLCLIFDLVAFYSTYTRDKEYFRFGRLLRPFKLLFYSQNMRRWFKSILHTWTHVLDIFILFILTILIFALLGIKVLGGEGAEEDKNNENNMDTFGGSFVTLYFLTSLSNYPNAIIPYCKVSNFFFLYFFPFIYVILLFFIPIPVAVVFDRFRKERSKLLLQDRMREKEAIFAVHCCIDVEQKGSVTYEEWDKLWEAIHGKSHSNQKENSDQLFEQYSAYDDMDIYEFFEACELALCLKETHNSYVCNPAWWQKLRNYLNAKLHLKAFVLSRGFELFIFVVILANVAVLISGEIVQEEKDKELCDNIDFYFIFIYLVEVILKIVGLGPVDYFADPWNKMDFSLVLTSLIIQTTLSFLKVAKYPSGLKALKSTSQARKAKSVKMLKGFRSIKACRVLSVITSPFARIKTMIYKVYLNIGTINTMVSIIMLIMYFYGIIGMECFHPNTRDIKSSYYESDTYGDFSSFSMTLIALFQILTQSSWHSMTLHFADNFDYTGTIIYFGSFHLIQVIILLNLTSGLIWEVFTIVPSDEILEEVEAQNIEEDKMSPKKRKSSTKNLLMFEENDPKKPIDRSDALKKMDDIPEVISSESSSHGSASDSENPSLTAPIQGSNMQNMAKRLGSDVSSKLLLRAALLKDSNVGNLREKEINEIKNKYKGSLTKRFNNIKEKKNYIKILSPVLITLLRVFRKTTLYTKIIASFNKAVSKINYELPRFNTIIILNEIEIRTEEGIEVKLYCPFFTEDQNLPLEITSLLTDLLDNDLRGNSYTMEHFLDELDLNKKSTYTKQEINHKKKVFREIVEITNILNSEFSNLEPKKGIDLDVLVETIEVNQETLDTTMFDEKQEIKNLNYLHQAILPNNKTKKMVLKNMHFICLKPNITTTAQDENPEAIEIKVLRGLLRDIRDMVVLHTGRILIALTEYYNIVVLDNEGDNLLYTNINPALSIRPSEQELENSLKEIDEEDDDDEFLTMGSAFDLDDQFRIYYKYINH